MKITKAKLRKGESLTINGYDGEISEGQLFDFKYLKGDILGIVIDDEVYEEASTAFDFVQITLPSQKKMWELLEAFSNADLNFDDTSALALQISELVEKTKESAK